MTARATNLWSEDEDAVIERLYPQNGPQPTHAALRARGFDRSVNSVRARASAIGVRHRNPGKFARTRRPATRHAVAWNPLPITTPDGAPRSPTTVAMLGTALQEHPDLGAALTGELVDAWVPHTTPPRRPR